VVGSENEPCRKALSRSRWLRNQLSMPRQLVEQGSPCGRRLSRLLEPLDARVAIRARLGVVWRVQGLVHHPERASKAHRDIQHVLNAQPQEKRWHLTEGLGLFRASQPLVLDRDAHGLVAPLGALFIP
jgi:hypothetical protein